MSDKERIKQEIKRLIAIEEETSNLDKISFNSGRWKALTQVKAFIDSLPEEPTSEDLEEEIERCWKEMFPNGWPDYTLLTLTYEEHKAFAHHFANWQKQNIKEALQTEYEKGRFDMAQWKDEQFDEEKKDLLGLVNMLSVDEHNQTIIEDLKALLQ